LVTGVDNDGALLLKTRSGERRYSTGEISLRAEHSP
jgi:biotin-(acetyl-CoA carboxylase) ligase